MILTFTTTDLKFVFPMMNVRHKKVVALGIDFVLPLDE